MLAAVVVTWKDVLGHLRNGCAQFVVFVHFPHKPKNQSRHLEREQRSAKELTDASLCVFGVGSR